MISLQSLRRMKADGLYECGSCLSRQKAPVVECGPEDPAFRSGLCRRCWAYRSQRTQELADIDAVKCGGLSCDDRFEEFCKEYPYAGYTSREELRAVGMRFDARWYKKAGGNGDG